MLRCLVLAFLLYPIYRLIAHPHIANPVDTIEKDGKLKNSTTQRIGLNQQTSLTTCKIAFSFKLDMLVLGTMLSLFFRTGVFLSSPLHSLFPDIIYLSTPCFL
jgi:hypothetical protein